MLDEDPIYVWQKINKDEAHLAGQLNFIPSQNKKPEKYIFDYDPDFEGIVSLIDAEDKVTYEGRLPPIFEMNLPEGARMQAVTKHHGKVLPANMAYLLTFSGRNGIGCLAYSYSNEGIEEPTIQDMPNHQQFIEQGKELFQSLFDELSVNDGIAGVQPKLLALSPEKNPTNSSAIDARTWVDKDYIVKGDNKDFPALAAVEYLSMRAAQFSGIPIPDITLSADQELLLVKRFDINEQGHSLAVEESASLCHKGNKNKYQGLYSEFAEALSEYSSAPLEDLSIYFRMIVLNNLIKNGDAHHKNFAVTYDPKSVAETVRLSPAYDIVSTVPYIEEDIPALALSYKHLSKKWFKDEELIDFGIQYTGLNKKIAREIIKEVRQGIKDTFSLIKEIESKQNHNTLQTLKDYWLKV